MPNSINKYSNTAFGLVATLAFTLSLTPTKPASADGGGDSDKEKKITIDLNIKKDVNITFGKNNKPERKAVRGHYENWELSEKLREIRLKSLKKNANNENSLLSQLFSKAEALQEVDHSVRIKKSDYSEISSTEAASIVSKPGSAFKLKSKYFMQVPTKRVISGKISDCTTESTSSRSGTVYSDSESYARVSFNTELTVMGVQVEVFEYEKQNDGEYPETIAYYKYTSNKDSPMTIKKYARFDSYNKGAGGSEANGRERCDNARDQYSADLAEAIPKTADDPKINNNTQQTKSLPKDYSHNGYGDQAIEPKTTKAKSAK